MELNLHLARPLLSLQGLSSKLASPQHRAHRADHRLEVTPYPGVLLAFQAGLAGHLNHIHIHPALRSHLVPVGLMEHSNAILDP